jgi:ABC-type Zn uptake system ZnuABC Zn-binding protein ZnuA
VVATTADLAAIATAVGGDAVSVTTLARPTEDAHFVDPKPSFIRTLNRADVLIEGGAALEAGWLPPLLDGARNAKIAAGAPGRIVATTGITLREIPTQLDRSLGDVHPFGNPHFLLDPLNGKAVAGTIARGFCTVDAGRCPSYEAGVKTFAESIDRRLPEWQRTLAPARGAKLVTYHKDFDYLASRFGLEVLGTLEPKPGVPPTPTHLAELIPRMQAAHVKAILIEPYRDRSTPDFVAEKTGAKVLVLPIMPDGTTATDYPAVIDNAVRQIAAALGS